LERVRLAGAFPFGHATLAAAGIGRKAGASSTHSKRFATIPSHSAFRYFRVFRGSLHRSQNLNVWRNELREKSFRAQRQSVGF
jgi:hypothetical protein